ncbi:arylsulfatase precursor [Thelonectria olida]|uniref:Arylsulfatase n=1 Tax=Thelonectria olida TaxID=1576542 RepID=A0A9P8VN48_9HYPO|nr:arylsulfatase precursor [Thelonectria olida]
MALPVFILGALVLALHAIGGSANDHSYGHKKPSFIFIMTDDQDLHLNSLDYQPIVQKQFVQKGTWFKKHFCTVALCCPSRVSLLTGRAAHNTNVTDFIAEGLNENYLPVWLQAAGYNTYYTGKLMNGQTPTTYNKPFAAGWTRSDFLLDPNTYIYNNASMVLDRGTPKLHTGKYSTDLIANRSVEFLGEAITARKPFFLGITPIAPHSETLLTSSGPVFKAPVPADRHRHLFPHAKVPRTPNFNPGVPGSVNYFATLPKLSHDQVKYNDAYYRRRLQALQAVDDLVSSVISKLEAHPDVLANTYLFYTSDNGYHIGQHRLPPGKTCNKEEDINIPFLVRGPGIAAGEVATFPTSHTDLVPTFFELAGIPLHANFDGEPIPLTKKSQNSKKRKHEHVNVEFWGEGVPEGTVFPNIAGQFAKNTYKTLRIVGPDYDFSYSVWCTNEHELYDIKADPFQLNNLYSSKSATSGFSIPELTARLDSLLLTLKSCKAKVCRRPWEALFPSGQVHDLRRAMHKKYDSFFLEQEKVTFSACLKGYITSAEGALKSKPYGGDDWDREFEARWEDWT